MIKAKEITVELDGNRDYQIHIGQQLLEQVPDILSELNTRKRAIIISNDVVDPLYGDKLDAALTDAGFEVTSITLPDGEEHKNIDTVNAVWDNLLPLQIERQDWILALGGGVIGDISGFIASTLLRGVQLLQIPTSLLAQVDACIGGKTGVNHETGKNLIGTFYQPRAVIADMDVLSTLPKREVLCGLAEIVKYGVIAKAELFDYIETHLSTFASLSIINDLDKWQHLIYESAVCKADIVTQDEREKGIRETLNFGHTIGHGIEAAANYGVFHHGEAVAIGMNAASYIAEKMGVFSSDDRARLNNLLTGLGFEITAKDVDVRRVITAMSLDKKVRDGRIRFILPTSIGTVDSRDDVPQALIEEAVQLVCKS